MKSKTKIDSDGNKFWRNSQGQYHNEEGPAWISAHGTQAWFINGETHRENGPAVIYSDDDKSWWIDGEEIS